MTVGHASSRFGLRLASTLAVVGFLVWSWPLPRHLSTHTLALAPSATAEPAAAAEKDPWSRITANDQTLSLWSATENARAIVRGDFGGVLAQGQCYPMPAATVLGEHLIELGILLTPWWLLSGDPLVAFNLSVAATLVIAAAGMFLFLYRHTASVPAALAGAIAFAFSVPRLADMAAHPAVVGTHWIPWVLWAFDGVLAGEGRIAMVVFAATLTLSMLVGAYPLLAIGIVGGAYGAVQVASRWRRGELDKSAVAMCVAAALPAFAVVTTILAAYASVQHEWQLEGHPGGKFVVGLTDYLPGGAMQAGIPALLGFFPLLLIRPGVARSAVPALAAATLLSLVLATALPLPGGGTYGIYQTLADRFAMLDAVRAPGKAGLAVCFGLQALGMIGWSRLIRTMRPRTSALLASTLLALTAAEVAPPRVAQGALGTGAEMELRAIAPPRDRIDALVSALGDDRRAVLDLPTGMMVRSPAALLDAVWHGHPTSACYNSLASPLTPETRRLADHSHTARGVMELAAAGFGFVIERPRNESAGLSATSFPPPARLLVFENDIAIWALPHPAVVHRDISKLAFAAKGYAPRPDEPALEPSRAIDVEVTNRGEEMWAAPHPLTPLRVQVTLSSADGNVVFRSNARGPLPLALSPGEKAMVQFTMPEAPPAGEWRADVQIDRRPAG